MQPPKRLWLAAESNQMKRPKLYTNMREDYMYTPIWTDDLSLGYALAYLIYIYLFHTYLYSVPALPSY